MAWGVFWAEELRSSASENKNNNKKRKFGALASGANDDYVITALQNLVNHGLTCDTQMLIVKINICITHQALREI